MEDDRWDFEGLSEEEQRRTQTAEPLWPGGTGIVRRVARSEQARIPTDALSIQQTPRAAQQMQLEWPRCPSHCWARTSVRHQCAGDLGSLLHGHRGSYQLGLNATYRELTP